MSTMYSITYSLKCNEENSDEYYITVRDFTDVTVVKSEKLQPMIDEFIEYIKAEKNEEVRQPGEYILELLSFGILWQNYAHIALKVRFAPFRLLSNMAEWRKKHQRIKPFLDTLRGIMTTLFLLPEKNYTQIPAPPPTLKQLEHVYKWFMSTGEFREQALRFTLWRSFWETKPPDYLATMFGNIESFTFWFNENAKKELGKYTENVNTFLKNAKDHYKYREDRIQCSRSESEYHLNMVGAELMNRAFRSEFKKTEGKALLVPGCMRILSADKCKAIKVEGGLKCVGCTTECRVNSLREEGKKENYTVYIIPHASDLSLWSPSKRQESLGVVASACLTTLVEGGWELKRYSVPAQCVILDYCGCKKHWHPTGVPTELNKTELHRILS